MITSMIHSLDGLLSFHVDFRLLQRRLELGFGGLGGGERGPDGSCSRGEKSMAIYYLSVNQEHD